MEELHYRIFNAIVGLVFILLTGLFVYLIYLGYLTEVVAAMIVSWFFFLIVNEVPEDQKLLQEFLKPVKLPLTLLAYSTLFAVILTVIYILYMFVRHLFSLLVDMTNNSLRIINRSP